MKKLSIIFLSIILCAFLCACSNAQKSDSESTTMTTTMTTVDSISTTRSVVIGEETTSTTTQADNIIDYKKDNKETTIQTEKTQTDNDNVRVNVGDLI